MIMSDLRQLANQVAAPFLIALSLISSCPEAVAQPAPSSPPSPAFIEGIYCGVCHSNSQQAKAMRDSEERPIAPFDLWRSSAMANSARDPYWLAVVSVEALTAKSPSRAGIRQNRIVGSTIEPLLQLT